MPIGFDLESIREANGCVNYVETGLWDPRTDVSCRKALEAKFEKVMTMELRRDWVELAHQEFPSEIASGRLQVIHDDSNYLGHYLDKSMGKTVFFLDAHVDNEAIKGYKNMCPIFNELQAIKELDRKDHVILVDDLRMLIQPFPWGETSYGEKNFVEEIVRLIREINPNYIIEQLNGIIPNDVLYIHVES